MIHQLVFDGFQSRWNQKEDWTAVKELLENTNDHVIFVVTRRQLPSFKEQLKTHDLEKFAIVLHDHTVGVTNPNYRSDVGKLKVCILKGKGES